LQKLPFSPPSYTSAESEAAANCVRRGWTGTGLKNLEFEQKFAKYKNSHYASGLSSCTAALFLSLKALGINKGDEVITTAMTFCSTVNVILHCGAKPVLCDISPVTNNISIDDLEKKITSKTRVIIPVHYAGMPCEMDPLVSLAESHQIYIIEDCAHAIESKYKGRHLGTFGEVGCFSFYATKNIAVGEGGMAISKHESLISKISTLRLHGLSRDAWRRFESSQRKQYDVIDIGYKFNLTDIQASIGLIQLSRLEEMQKRRTILWEYYINELQNLDLQLPVLPSHPDSFHAKHLFAIGLPTNINRDEFIWNASQEFSITMGLHYNCLPTFSAYKHIWSPESVPNLFPHAYSWGQRTVSLSLSAAVTDHDVSRIVDATKKLLKSMS
jgi:dTDP-4-amino-4,6-dideoxygalactose transaminase